MSQTQQHNSGGTNYQVNSGENGTNFVGGEHYHHHETVRDESIHFNVPFQRNAYFTGRADLLTQLHTTLSQRRSVALTGLGGIGKTQTAVEYAYRYFEDQPVYQWVFWVRADSELELSTDFGDLALVLALPEQAEQETEKKIAAVKRWLAKQGNWLLIFDNADRPELLKPYLPINPKGSILATSRNPSFDVAGITSLERMSTLERQEAIEFLWKRTGQEFASEAEQQAAAALAAEFDDLPLALEQAGAYIREEQIQIQDYWLGYQQQRSTLLNLHLAGMQNYQASVATTWAINFAAVEKTSPAAADVLRLSALLAADAIPYELLSQGANHLGEAIQKALTAANTLPGQVPKLLKPLTRYSLITLEQPTQSYSIHRLVQEVLRQAMTPDQLQQWVNRAVAALNAAFPEVDYKQWTNCARLLPQVEAIQPHLPDELDEAEALGRLLNEAGNYLTERAQYQVAKPLLLRSLHDREATLGTDHPDVAESLNNLAALYYCQGRYDEAEPLYLRSLQIREATLGADHPDVAESLNNLAVLYDTQGRYDQTESLYKRSLQIREAALGTDHPDVATGLNDLAGLYYYQGRYDEAELLYLRSLHIWEATLGTDHPNVATSLNNLAGLYRNQGRYNEAESLYKRSLQIGEVTLGIDHLNIAFSLNNLAELYRDQGRYDEAEPLHKRSLQIREATLGTDHPDAATGLNNLALLYYHQGRYNEVEPLYKRSLQIMEVTLGTDHPKVAASLNNLAELYRDQGRYDEAKPLYKRSLQIREATLGTDHPDVAESLNNLAVLYYHQGRYNEAEPLYKRSLQIREATLGTDHPGVAFSLNNLAGLYYYQGRYDEAEPLYKQAIVIAEQRLGADHPDTVLYQENLQWLQQQISTATTSL